MQNHFSCFIKIVRSCRNISPTKIVRLKTPWTWTLLVLILVTPFTLHAHAGTQNSFRIAGKVLVWSRPACEQNMQCPLPQPLGLEWPVLLEGQRPEKPGRHLVVQKTLEGRGLQIQIQIFIVIGDQNEPPYIVTQTSLSHKAFGRIADCSRYDLERELRFLPPGACSGRAGKNMIGVSFSKR